MEIFKKHKQWFIVCFVLAAVAFFGPENILQAENSDSNNTNSVNVKRKAYSDNDKFVKCESWDDECFKQYEEELQDAQKDITRHEDVQESINQSEAAKHKEVVRVNTSHNEVINLNKSIKSMRRK